MFKYWSVYFQKLINLFIRDERYKSINKTSLLKRCTKKGQKLLVLKVLQVVVISERLLRVYIYRLKWNFSNMLKKKCPKFTLCVDQWVETSTSSTYVNLKQCLILISYASDHHWFFLHELSSHIVLFQMCLNLAVTNSLLVIYFWQVSQRKCVDLSLKKNFKPFFTSFL